MKRWICIVVALAAASCASPDAPDPWSVQRLTTPDERSDAEVAVCDDVRALALGSLAEQPELAPILDELARISAILGATAALPMLDELHALDDDPGLDGIELSATRHDLLLEASAAIDDATAAACGIPAFSALYATSGFPDCHFEMEIAVGAYTLADDAGTCRATGRPTVLPCWSTDDGHLPVDCTSGAIVHAIGERWEMASSPTPVTIERIPDEPEGPIVIAPSDAPECVALLRLFQDGDPPNGAAPEFSRLAAASADLDDTIRELVDQFIDANTSTPDLAEFEDLVAELDRATASACGFPIVSAWASILGQIDEPPCWVESGVTYPAHTQVDCG